MESPPDHRDGSPASAADPAQVVTVQEIQVAPEDVDAFVAHFQRLDVLRLAAEAAAGGLHGGVVLQNEDRFVVVTSWSSAAGIDAWIASPSRELVQAELRPYYVAPPVVNRYELIGRFPPADSVVEDA
jgi:heme-degrading monooxygenase HmoA